MTELRFLRELESEFQRVTDEQPVRGRRVWPRYRRSSAVGSGSAVLAMVISAVVVVAVGAVLLSVGHSRSTAASRSGRALGPAGGPVPSGFAVGSVTAINDRTWWVLGSASRMCGQRACAAIVRTTDAGRHFVAIPAPPVPYDSEPEGLTEGVAQIQFANARDGYAYNNSLFVTHDGGATWDRPRLPVPDLERVTEVTTADGEAYAIAESPAGGWLLRSPVGSDRWTVSRRTNYFVTAGGRDVYLTARIGSRTYILVSHNRGASFVADYSTKTENGCAVQPITAKVLWALCRGGMMETLYRSTDGGRTLHWVGRSLQLMDVAFAAASPTTAVVGFQSLYRTGDAGATFTRVPTPRAPSYGPRRTLQWSFFTFTDATHGLALAQPPEDTAGPVRTYLFQSTDGGRSYQQVVIPTRRAHHTEPTSRPCRANQLRLSLIPRPGITQDAGIAIALRDRSTSPCTLHGTPTAKAWRSTGRAIRIPHDRNAGYLPPGAGSATVSPGQPAFVQIYIPAECARGVSHGSPYYTRLALKLTPAGWTTIRTRLAASCSRTFISPYYN